MLMSQTQKEQSTQSRPFAAVHVLGLGLSYLNPFNGKLGQNTSRDRRHTRH